MNRNCKNCGVELERKKDECRRDWESRKFCQKSCYHAFHRQGPEEKVCIVCGETFSRPDQISNKLWNERIMCGSDCRAVMIRENKIGFQPGHKGYKSKTRFKKGHRTWNRGQKGRRPWHNISGLRPAYFKGKKLSEETKEKIRQARAKQTNIRRGKNHPNWKGGISPLRRRVMRLRIYRKWRSSVFERDNYTCQICLKRGGRLHAHHIKPYSVIIKENQIKTEEQAKKCSELWDVSNGETLCVECHHKTDTWGNRINSV